MKRQTIEALIDLGVEEGAGAMLPKVRKLLIADGNRAETIWILRLMVRECADAIGELDCTTCPETCRDETTRFIMVASCALLTGDADLANEVARQFNRALGHLEETGIRADLTDPQEIVVKYIN